MDNSRSLLTGKNLTANKRALLDAMAGLSIEEHNRRIKAVEAGEGRVENYITVLNTVVEKIDKQTTLLNLNLNRGGSRMSDDEILSYLQTYNNSRDVTTTTIEHIRQYYERLTRLVYFIPDPTDETASTYDPQGEFKHIKNLISKDSYLTSVVELPTLTPDHFTIDAVELFSDIINGIVQFFKNDRVGLVSKTKNFMSSGSTFTKGVLAGAMAAGGYGINLLLINSMAESVKKKKDQIRIHRRRELERQIEISEVESAAQRTELPSTTPTANVDTSLSEAPTLPSITPELPETTSVGISSAHLSESSPEFGSAPTANRISMADDATSSGVAPQMMSSGLSLGGMKPVVAVLQSQLHVLQLISTSTNKIHEVLDRWWTSQQTSSEESQLETTPSAIRGDRGLSIHGVDEEGSPTKETPGSRFDRVAGWWAKSRLARGAYKVASAAKNVIPFVSSVAGGTAAMGATAIGLGAAGAVAGGAATIGAFKAIATPTFNITQWKHYADEINTKEGKTLIRMNGGMISGPNNVKDQVIQYWNGGGKFGKPSGWAPTPESPTTPPQMPPSDSTPTTPPQMPPSDSTPTTPPQMPPSDSTPTTPPQMPTATRESEPSPGIMASVASLTFNQPQLGVKGQFPNRKSFIMTMMPYAKRASQKLGGIDPNALLTQWGFESAWGSRPSGKYNYFGIKDFSGAGESVTTQEVFNGKRQTMKQPFKNFSNIGDAVDGYVSFLQKNKRYEKAGVFEAKTSREYFSALQRAGYATDPDYAGKLTSATIDTAKMTSTLTEPSSASPAAPQMSSVPTVDQTQMGRAQVTTDLTNKAQVQQQGDKNTNLAVYTDNRSSSGAGGSVSPRTPINAPVPVAGPIVQQYLSD